MSDIIYMITEWTHILAEWQHIPLTTYYTMDIDKQLKAYYIIIATNTSSSFYLLSILEIIIKTTAELST